MLCPEDKPEATSSTKKRLRGDVKENPQALNRQGKVRRPRKDRGMVPSSVNQHMEEGDRATPVALKSVDSKKKATVPKSETSTDAETNALRYSTVRTGKDEAPDSLFNSEVSGEHTGFETLSTYETPRAVDRKRKTRKDRVTKADQDAEEYYAVSPDEVRGKSRSRAGADPAKSEDHNRWERLSNPVPRNRRTGVQQTTPDNAHQSKSNQNVDRPLNAESVKEKKAQAARQRANNASDSSMPVSAKDNEPHLKERKGRHEPAGAHTRAAKENRADRPNDKDRIKIAVYPRDGEEFLSKKTPARTTDQQKNAKDMIAHSEDNRGEYSDEDIKGFEMDDEDLADYYELFPDQKHKGPEAEIKAEEHGGESSHEEDATPMEARFIPTQEQQNVCGSNDRAEGQELSNDEEEQHRMHMPQPELMKEQAEQSSRNGRTSEQQTVDEPQQSVNTSHRRLSSTQTTESSKQHNKDNDRDDKRNEDPRSSAKQRAIRDKRHSLSSSKPLEGPSSTRRATLQPGNQTRSKTKTAHHQPPVTKALKAPPQGAKGDADDLRTGPIEQGTSSTEPIHTAQDQNKTTRDIEEVPVKEHKGMRAFHEEEDMSEGEEQRIFEEEERKLEEYPDQLHPTTQQLEGAHLQQAEEPNEEAIMDQDKINEPAVDKSAPSHPRIGNDIPIDDEDEEEQEKDQTVDDQKLYSEDQIEELEPEELHEVDNLFSSMPSTISPQDALQGMKSVLETTQAGGRSNTRHQSEAPERVSIASEQNRSPLKRAQTLHVKPSEQEAGGTKDQGGKITREPTTKPSDKARTQEQAQTAQQPAPGKKASAADALGSQKSEFQPSSNPPTRTKDRVKTQLPTEKATTRSRGVTAPSKALLRRAPSSAEPDPKKTAEQRSTKQSISRTSRILPAHRSSKGPVNGKDNKLSDSKQDQLESNRSISLLNQEHEEYLPHDTDSDQEHSTHVNKQQPTSGPSMRRATSKTTPNTGSKAGPKAITKADPKTGPKTRSNTGSRAGPKANTKADRKTGSKVGSKAGSKAGSKVGSKTGSKEGSKIGLKTDSNPGSKPEVEDGRVYEEHEGPLSPNRSFSSASGMSPSRRSSRDRTKAAPNSNTHRLGGRVRELGSLELDAPDSQTGRYSGTEDEERIIEHLTSHPSPNRSLSSINDHPQSRGSSRYNSSNVAAPHTSNHSMRGRIRELDSQEQEPNPKNQEEQWLEDQNNEEEERVLEEYTGQPRPIRSLSSVNEFSPSKGGSFNTKPALDGSTRGTRSRIRELDGTETDLKPQDEQQDRESYPQESIHDYAQAQGLRGDEEDEDERVLEDFTGPIGPTKKPSNDQHGHNSQDKSRARNQPVPDHMARIMGRITEEDSHRRRSLDSNDEVADGIVQEECAKRAVDAQPKRTHACSLESDHDASDPQLTENSTSVVDVARSFETGPHPADKSGGEDVEETQRKTPQLDPTGNTSKLESNSEGQVYSVGQGRLRS